MKKIDFTKLNLTEKVIYINRCTKVVKGGRRFSFSALAAVGDKQGYVGVGLGKATEVPDAIRKAIDKAKNSLIFIPINGSTIPYSVEAKFGASKVLLKPASPGTGVIAGGAVRIILELVGTKDILTKSIGSSNAFNVASAILLCLKEIKKSQDIGVLRGKIKKEREKEIKNGEVIGETT